MDSVIRKSISPLTAVHSYAIVIEILYRINNTILYLVFCGCNRFEKQRTIRRVVIFLEKVLRLHNFVSRVVGEKEGRKKHTKIKFYNAANGMYGLYSLIKF